MVIVGAGGHGRVVADLCELLGRWDEIVFLDELHPGLQECDGWQVVGANAGIAACAAGGCDFGLGVGNNALRMKLFSEIEKHGGNLPPLIHPRATLSKRCRIGTGAVVLANAAVNISADIGRGSILNTSSSVDHDCRLGAGVHVCPGVHLAGDVKVGDLTLLGVGCSVKQCITIVSRAIVGAGAAVVCDIADGAVVAGVPARPLQRSRAHS